MTRDEQWAAIIEPMRAKVDDYERITDWLKYQSISHPAQRAYNNAMAAYHRAGFTKPKPATPPPMPSLPSDPELVEINRKLDHYRELEVAASIAIGEAILAKYEGEDAMLWKLSKP